MIRLCELGEDQECWGHKALKEPKIWTFPSASEILDTWFLTICWATVGKDPTPLQLTRCLDQICFSNLGSCSLSIIAHCGISKLVRTPTLPPWNTVDQKTERSNCLYFCWQCSLLLCCTVYCITHNAWSNPAMQGKGFETNYSEMLA